MMQTHASLQSRLILPYMPAMSFSLSPLSLLLPIATLVLPLTALASEPVYDCQGKTRFVHRGAPSTVPADARRHYPVDGGQLEGLACQITDVDISCHGLTPQQAYRRVVIDRVAKTVSDTMELPTSMLIFEGRCD